MPKVKLNFGIAACWRQLLLQTRLEISEIVPRTPFLTLLAFGLMLVVAHSLLAESQMGMPSHPLTHLMLVSIERGGRLTLTMIIVLYAGELVFSQHSLKMSGIYDALPVPNWIFLGAKLLPLVSVLGIFLLGAAFSTLAIQLSQDFTPVAPNLEDVYFTALRGSP